MSLPGDQLHGLLHMQEYGVEGKEMDKNRITIKFGVDIEARQCLLGMDNDSILLFCAGWRLALCIPMYAISGYSYSIIRCVHMAPLG